MVSSSVSESQTNKIGCCTSTIIVPTQGAKSPFKPIFIDWGIKPLLNSAEEFADKFDKNAIVIDVRKEGEYAAEHVEDAFSKPLAYINDWLSSINNNQHFFLHCAGGYRSMIAASILQARGYRNFSEIEGGFNAIKKTEKIPTTDFVCQSKTLS